MSRKNSKKEVFDIHRTLPNKKLHHHRSAATKDRIEKVAEITNAEKRRGFSISRAAAGLVLLVFIFVLVIAVWDAVQLSKASKKMFGSGNLFSLVGGDLANQNGRTNILLVGYSVDDPGHPGSLLTDSIMLLSLNNKNKTGYILSIPRDLYVNIPDYGQAKINEAYQAGERSNFYEPGLPAGGIGLLQKVISNNLAVTVNYYSLINYAAFRDTVNALGGVSLNIDSSDPRGLYDPNISPADKGPLKLANGTQKLDGQTALNLARARGDHYLAYGFPQADFDRTKHQRQLMLALKQQSVSWGVILNPLKAGHLFDGMANNVKTDLDTGNVLPLFMLFNDVKDLKSVGLRDINGKNYLGSYGGALVPLAGIRDYSDIQAAIEDLNSQ
jgi:polyisoprenyl-teichoic acid--peptidoglycan teichoic acid transferase